MPAHHARLARKLRHTYARHPGQVPTPHRTDGHRAQPVLVRSSSAPATAWEAELPENGIGECGVHRHRPHGRRRYVELVTLVVQVLQRGDAREDVGARRMIEILPQLYHPTETFRMRWQASTVHGAAVYHQDTPHRHRGGCNRTSGHSLKLATKLECCTTSRAMRRFEYDREIRLGKDDSREMA
jgi:hypothetical protein